MTNASHFASELLAHVPGLRAFAMCLVPDSKQADDLVEKVLAAAWNKQPRLEAEGLRARLFLLMHREFRSLERARLLGRVARAERRPLRRLHSRPGIGGRFGTLLHGLPAMEREALALVGVCTVSFEEAAMICSCDTTTVKRRVENACEHLSDEMSASQARGKLLRRQQRTWRPIPLMSDVAG